MKYFETEITAYGICPSCLNPIQLIGIFGQSKISPYGKHTGKNIDGLPEWDLVKYKYCPYAAKGYKQPEDEELLPEIDSSVTELYELLKAQFDRVVYIIQKELHIRCSTKFWESALRQYLVNRAYCYPRLTEANLPYIFAYFGMRQHNCYGQEFEVGTELYKALEAYPNVKFIENERNPDFKRLSNNGNGGLLKLVFRFTNYRQIAKSGEALEETFKFCVDDNCNGKTIYEEIIKFDETHFMNLINKKGNENNRQERLLSIADKLTPGLRSNV